MTSMEQPQEPRVRVLPPEDALKAARPLPSRDQFVIEDVSEGEWEAFAEALAEA